MASTQLTVDINCTIVEFRGRPYAVIGVGEELFDDEKLIRICTFVGETQQSSRTTSRTTRRNTEWTRKEHLRRLERGHLYCEILKIARKQVRRQKT